MGSAIYRPAQWQGALGIQTVMLIFPGQPTQAQYSAEGISATLPNSTTLYVFDCTPRIGHEQEIAKTRHPVQTGASISDHAYLEPARLTLEIGMSDAQDAYSPNLWVGGPTKSVSAYQIILAMAFARIPLSVVTRLRTYGNMLIVNVPAEDTHETYAGLKMRLVLEEIFVASTQVTANSARPDATTQTPTGNPSPTPPTAAQVTNNKVPSSLAASIPKASNVLGAGPWCSVNCSQIAQLIQ